MLLSIIALAAVGAIAYWHYTQGFFSSALSAILAIVASALAIGLHEFVMVRVLAGKFPDVGQGLILAVLFALIYVILRVIFDKLVPGNVQVPVMVDKIGAGVMGVIAGIFAGGVLLIAIQDLPFGPSIAGFQRYALSPTLEVANPVKAGSMSIFDPLKDETLSPSGRAALWVSVDEMVIGAASRLSSGALSWQTSFSDIHPSYLDEAYFIGLGVQPGARHVAVNSAADQQVSVQGLYTVPLLPQVDGEEAYITGRWTQPLTAQIKPDSGNMILIVRLSFGRNAADPDGNVRIGTWGVRLVAGGTNYHPFGTLDYSAGVFVRANRPDDFLFVPADGLVDFVFLIPSDVLGLPPSDPKKPAPMTVGPGIFLEAKRLGLVDLSGNDIRKSPPEVPATTILRKKNMPLPKGAVPVVPAASPGAAPAGGGGGTTAPVEGSKAELSSKFFVAYNTARYEEESGDVTFPTGTASIRGKKFAKLTINPGPAISQVSAGDWPIEEFWTPDQTRMVLISATPPSSAATGWEWAQKLSQFELVDSTGKTYKPNGAWAKIQEGTTTKMFARYDAENPIPDIAMTAGRPTQLWIAFVVQSEGTTLQELRFAGARVIPVNLPMN